MTTRKQRKPMRSLTEALDAVAEQDRTSQLSEAEREWVEAAPVSQSPRTTQPAKPKAKATELVSLGARVPKDLVATMRRIINAKELETGQRFTWQQALTEALQAWIKRNG